MTTATSTTITTDGVVATLETLVHAARTVVDDVAVAVGRALATGAAPRGTVRGDLQAVEPLVRRALGDAPGLVHGAGFVSAPQSLVDSPWWLEWFAWDGPGRVQRLLTDTDPDGAHFFDYTLMPWFADPARTGRQTVTGPYVDYLCTDDYTLTFTAPVTDAGAFRGVAGADVRVITLERRLLAALRRTERLTVVVNTLGRIVTSNSPRLLSGDLVDADVAALLAAEDPRLRVVADSELAVLDLGAR